MKGLKTVAEVLAAGGVASRGEAPTEIEAAFAALGQQAAEAGSLMTLARDAEKPLSVRSAAAREARKNLRRLSAMHRELRRLSLVLEVGEERGDVFRPAVFESGGVLGNLIASCEELQRELTFAESNNPGYIEGTMGDAEHDLNEVAANLGYTFETARITLERQAAEAARETTTRATAGPRLKWDKDRQDGEEPPEFIKRAYAVELATGRLHKGVIRSEDSKLYDALFNWLRDPAHKLDFELPTKAEWNTRRIEERRDDPAAREAARLHEVARKRRRTAERSLTT